MTTENLLNGLEKMTTAELDQWIASFEESTDGYYALVSAIRQVLSDHGAFRKDNPLTLSARELWPKVEAVTAKVLGGTTTSLALFAAYGILRHHLESAPAMWAPA